MLADGTLIFRWLADTDGYAKLFIYRWYIDSKNKTGYWYVTMHSKYHMNSHYC